MKALIVFAVLMALAVIGQIAFELMTPPTPGCEKSICDSPLSVVPVVVVATIFFFIMGLKSMGGNK